MEIRKYEDFVEALLDCGFSMGGSNSEGVFALITWGWKEAPPYETPVCWHTEDPETDPWEWRMRVLDERNDIAYGKLFFKKSGYITREWYPYFLAARRGRTTLAEAYGEGTISREAKRIYEVIRSEGALPVHEIKRLGSFSKEDNSRFDRGLTELQMKLYLTMCGRQQKLSQEGAAYGWSSNVLCTTEEFWGREPFDEAAGIRRQDAIAEIEGQIFKLNPDADKKKAAKFITG